MDTLELARAEQADLVSFLRTLDAHHWDSPSLCAGWSVRDVVAHLASYDAVDQRDVGRRFLRRGLSLRGANAAGLEELSGHTPQELVELLAHSAGTRGLPPRIGGWVVFGDTLIHHQDIRRPLGLPREIPVDRLRAALRFASYAPPLRGFWKIRGVRVIATDVEWRAGRGPEAWGPGEAVLMTLAGRPGASRDLQGPGAAVLEERLG